MHPTASPERADDDLALYLRGFIAPLWILAGLAAALLALG